MKPPEPDPDRRSPGGAHVFDTTHWSVVLGARREDSPEGDAALERLCQIYWYPLYVFVRRKGHLAHDAQDLTQEFFSRFLEKKYFALAEQSRGKFRTFLLRSLEHFLINEWAKSRASKRGGGNRITSWDKAEAEKRYSHDKADAGSPAALYEKRWALSVLAQVMARLQEEFRAEKAELFESLKCTIWGEEAKESYQQIGATLGMEEGAVKVAVHRMRQRFRELLRLEVAHTVSTPAEVDEELRYLAAILRG